MRNPTVTIDLSEYNRLLEDSKNYRAGFRSTHLKYESYNHICGYSSEILCTDDDAVKAIMDELAANKKEMNKAIMNTKSAIKSATDLLIEYNELPYYKRFFRNIRKEYVDKINHING